MTPLDKLSKIALDQLSKPWFQEGRQAEIRALLDAGNFQRAMGHPITAVREPDYAAQAENALMLVMELLDRVNELESRLADLELERELHPL